jgi:hypothetical protein
VLGVRFEGEEVPFPGRETHAQRDLDFEKSFGFVKVRATELWVDALGEWAKGEWVEGGEFGAAHERCAIDKLLERRCMMIY